MALDYDKIRNWSFKPHSRTYTRADLVGYAAAFGAGLPGPLQVGDARFLDAAAAEPLPMVAVALADADFWQADPAAGLNWKQIVHAQECITVHRQLLPADTVTLERHIVDIFDRGIDRGAMVAEQQVLRSSNGEPIATIDVLTVLRADGGFGGSSDGAPKPVAVPADRSADLEVTLPSLPSVPVPMLALGDQFAVTGAVAGTPGQSMLRGLAAFGLAGRAVLHLLCGNDPSRLRKLAVRYAGPLMTDETVRVEVWRTGRGRAAFRMSSLQRDRPVLHHCHVEFDE